MQHCWWDTIKVSYDNLNISGVKKSFNLHITPSELDILFDSYAHVHSMQNADR